MSRSTVPGRHGVSVRALASHGADRATVVTAGEIDAANARQFADAVLVHVNRSTRLVLDLTRVTFMAVDGLSALHAINAELMRTGVEWELLPSVEVHRMLEVCRVGSLLPALPPTARSPRLQRVGGRTA